MSKREPTARQIEASKKRWHKLVERMHKAEAPLIRKKAAVEKKFDMKIYRLERQKEAAVKKLWAAIARKRAPLERRIDKEIAFKLS